MSTIICYPVAWRSGMTRRVVPRPLCDAATSRRRFPPDMTAGFAGRPRKCVHDPPARGSARAAGEELAKVPVEGSEKVFLFREPDRVPCPPVWMRQDHSTLVKTAF